MTSERAKNHLIPNSVIKSRFHGVAGVGRLCPYSPTPSGAGFYLFLLLVALIPLWTRVGVTQTPAPALEAVEDMVPPDEREQPPLELQQMPPEKPPLQFLTIPPEIDPAQFNITTNYTISQSGVTVPSLWWVNEQFGYRLVENWLAYPRNGGDTGTVDVIVNRQSWGLLDYLQRYEFLNHFGQVGRDYGYNIRVFTRQQKLLGSYTCTSEPIACNLWLDSEELDSQTP
ncbi:hypothetical protein [Laspinema olomoucense]|uniref:hypothetical protein n=1 Tax=Laspinema olomoucense TaxID=3231600 RepID=UPI0021BAED76|nr:hypothetical protein [Laspinema sp. D3d]MCT7972363.1 hypothetical protein [Laspinema sp. D3d]